MLERETQRREKEKPRLRERKPGIKTSSGSMKCPNLTPRGKLDRNVTTSRGNKQLVGKRRFQFVLEAAELYCLDSESTLREKQWTSSQHPA